jgi:hypothetical protein
MGVVIVTSAALGWAPGFAEVQYQSAPSQQAPSGAPSDGAAPNAGPTESGTANDRPSDTAGEVGARLHDSAKSFGEALLGGIKYVGHTVTGFFTGDKTAGDKSK